MENAKRTSVLIVDDESANIIALTHILSPEHNLYAATDGTNAIRLAKSHLPDVILLDIIMPEPDGYEVFNTLKSDEDTKNIPIIFISGLVEDADEEKGLEMGAADYIFKPFRAVSVRMRVNNVVKFRDLRLSEELEQQNELNRVLFENAPIGLTVFDENFKYIDCNENILEMFGVSREFYKDFFGGALHSPELQPDGSNSRVKAMELIRRVMDGETIKAEWLHNTPNGEPLPVELTMMRTKRGGKYVGLAYIYDMRKQVKLKNEMTEASSARGSG